jgi:5-methylcytosine-specific restriction endonuclease McrA
VAINLEIDHWQVPYIEGGPSELWNLCRLCRHHHRLKTFDGYRLRGGPGKWEWLPPE